MVAQKPHSTNQDIFCNELLWLNWDITISNQSYLSEKEFVRCIDSGLSRLVYVYGFCCGLPRAYSSVLGLVAQCAYTLVHISLPFAHKHFELEDCYLSAKEFVRCIDSGLSRLVYVYGFCCGLSRAYSSVLGLVVAQCTYTLVHIL